VNFRFGMLEAEPAQKRGLADAGLATEKHQTSPSLRRLSKPAGENAEELEPLEQLERALAAYKAGARLVPPGFCPTAVMPRA
jgi:hypothetical protein